MTPTILWTLVVATVVVGVAMVTAIGKARAKASRALNEPLRRIHPACSAGGHNYRTYDTGYRCATCGNYVSSCDGEFYGRVEDGQLERRREPR